MQPVFGGMLIMIFTSFTSFLKVKSQIITEHLHLYICLSLHCTKLKYINRGRHKTVRLLKSGGHQFFSTRRCQGQENQHFYPFFPFFMNRTSFKDPISPNHPLILNANFFLLKETIDVVNQNFTNFL